jgi:hypothetical protein
MLTRTGPRNTANLRLEAFLMTPDLFAVSGALWGADAVGSMRK